MFRKPGLFYICPKCGRIKSGSKVVTDLVLTMMCDKCMVMMVEVSPTGLWRKVKEVFEDKGGKGDKDDKRSDV
ncbi:hypothetical protein BKN38_09890 [Helicobacter sp. CLO-3]|uniref:hypothetical protein n=1 Tax=unclassified Helicobacter TaxID=2593540 RepID=UPI00080499BA|nr:MULTISPECIES: hypothetical protein [unclassified Helicobacter]OBV28591.1 hypothetical protein BA723_08805 [Helicobacter sp. CLO-3]OHU81039.1 hypothetical protein BKN38_09890 [Helicobacter sp. CLO-3]